ncbi:MAG TPA: thiamine-phosphate kinase [Rhodocyclaceae bacterium]|jgi:thiamine-monophosphate kinase|nr:thiamine-phosphate kinase [Rhodocyclaceae bacterium]
MTLASTPEFALIARHFKRATRHTLLAGGDDGALIQASSGHELVISTDMLVAGTHFYADTNAEDLGWKTLAVNISDMAAMGAQPRWATLAMSLPDIEESWIAAFAKGFYDCAENFSIDLIGGDTTRGPLNFCVTIFGEVPAGQAIRRSGAKPDDDVWISGQPGRAGLGLAQLQGKAEFSEPQRGEYLKALTRPQPRVALGLALRGLATAALDISDGLLADLGHILEESHCAAELQFTTLPPPGIQRDMYLGGGDDYELAFTVPAARHHEVNALSGKLGLPLTHIGHITAGNAGDIHAVDATGTPIMLPRRGYDHFA